MGKVGWPHKEKETKRDKARRQSQVLLPHLWPSWPLVPLTMGMGEGYPRDSLDGLYLSHEVEHSRVEGSLNLWVEKEQLTTPLVKLQDIYILFLLCLVISLSGFQAPSVRLL